MPTLPTLPPWEGMHPLIIHVPIGLISVALLPALLALLMPSRRTMFVFLTFFVALLGATGTVVATMSGDAAHHSAHERGLITAAVHDTLEAHEAAGDRTRNVWLIMTLLWGGVAIGARKGKLEGAAGAAVSAVMFVLTIGGFLVMADAADLGAQLVHRYGIHAPLGPAPAAPAADAPRVPRQDDDDGD